MEAVVSSNDVTALQSGGQIKTPSQNEQKAHTKTLTEVCLGPDAPGSVQGGSPGSHTSLSMGAQTRPQGGQA